MRNNDEDQNNVFKSARDILNQDTSIQPEEKEGILKLIQVLIDVADASPYPRDKNNQIKTFTQEIISKHSLMVMVKQQADELDALKRIGLNLSSSLDLQTVLNAIVAEAMKLVKNAYAAHIFLYSQGMLEFGAALNSAGDINKAITLPRPNGITYSVANQGVPIIIENMNGHPLYKDFADKHDGSIIGMPLKFNNSVVGVMNLSRTIRGDFTKAEMRLLGLLADQAAIAISNASLHKGVTEMAHTDSVTGLPNRRALDERLHEEMRYSRRMNSQFSVVMMDLDGFKNVNDTFGHGIGDDVLRSVFNYLAEKMRATDFLARYGGDELSLVIRDGGLDVAEVVTHKILELMSAYTFTLPAGKVIQLGVTAGIAVYPLHSRNAADLLRAADTALYQAKKHNRGSFSIAKGITGQLPPLRNSDAHKD